VGAEPIWKQYQKKAQLARQSSDEWETDPEYINGSNIRDSSNHRPPSASANGPSARASALDMLQGAQSTQAKRTSTGVAGCKMLPSASSQQKPLDMAAALVKTLNPEQLANFLASHVASDVLAKRLAETRASQGQRTSHKASPQMYNASL